MADRWQSGVSEVASDVSNEWQETCDESLAEPNEPEQRPILAIQGVVPTSPYSHASFHVSLNRVACIGDRTEKLKCTDRRMPMPDIEFGKYSHTGGHPLA